MNVRQIVLDMLGVESKNIVFICEDREKVKIGIVEQFGRKGSEYESLDIEKCMSFYFYIIKE